MPWSGFMYNSDGRVKNCIRSAGSLGNLIDNSITDILNSETNTQTKKNMLAGQPGLDCHPCYDLEQNKNSFDIIDYKINLIIVF
jgi:hypothetical protein